jgi:phosphoglycerate kinase
MNKLVLQELPIQDKKVLMRVDFNVPLDKEGKITDETRIKEALPSIEYILKAGGAVILMSHLGRPKGKRDPEFSLAPCREALSALLKMPVQFASDCVGAEAEKKARDLKIGEVLLLENLRFYAAEEKPELDPSFAEKLSKLGDLYVNDAFGAAHRAHASIATITQYFPGKAAAGLLMQKEISFLEPLVKNPKHPFYALIGGAKVSSKIGVLESLLTKVDTILIGGAMAFTFFKAQGISVGDSLCEEDLVEKARHFLKACASKKVKLLLPEDLVIASAFQDDAPSKIIVSKEGIPSGWQGMDIGPRTIASWQTELAIAQTIFWNGPMGVFEFPHFATGTNALAKSLSKLKSLRIVGGGDSVSAINALNLAKHFSHISTGGGASLEFIEFGYLPGIDALSNKF